MRVFNLQTNYIQLDQLLKAAGLCGSGGEAKAAIQSGQVIVDSAIETRRGRKLRGGETVFLGSESVSIKAKPPVGDRESVP
jgi:ribosome-associated protein